MKLSSLPANFVLWYKVLVVFLNLFSIQIQQGRDLQRLVVLEACSLRIQNVEVFSVSLLNFLKCSLGFLGLMLLHCFWNHHPGNFLIFALQHLNILSKVSNLCLLADLLMFWPPTLIDELLSSFTDCFLGHLMDIFVLLFFDVRGLFFLKAELLQPLRLALDPLSLKLLLLLLSYDLFLPQLL